MKRVFSTIVLSFILATLTLGQSGGTLPSFDAADARPSPKGLYSQLSGGVNRGGRYQVRNATMLNLISSAYGVAAEKVHGGPSWLEVDKFDILAKVPDNTSDDTAKLMLRSLLADRFKLIIRSEDQPTPAYAITQGKEKHLLKATQGGAEGCQPIPQADRPGVVQQQAISCRNLTMAAFAPLLKQAAPADFDNKLVIDRTELKGGWDFEIRWTAKRNLAAAGADGITIFDAVRKQLSLNLEVQDHPSPVLIVDSVNRIPTANQPGVEKLLPAVSTEFEVADLKPTDPRTQGRQGNTQAGGRLELRGSTLKQLIMLAWGTNNVDMVETPKWVETERFDFIAKAPADVVVTGNADVDTMSAMLRALLVERFRIKYHTEDRSINAYALVTTRKDPRLKQADPASRTTCNRTGASNPSGVPMLNLTCQNATMGFLVERLPGMTQPYIDRPLVDLTKLEGGYDFVLSWTPRGAFDNGGRAPGEPGAAADPNGAITLSEGLEKLGLKLEQQKHPFPVLVIDSLEPKPVEN